MKIMRSLRLMSAGAGCIAAVLACQPSGAAMVLFDDFNSYSVGNGSGGQQLSDVTGGVWQQTPSFTSNADIEDDGGGDLYFAYGTSGTFRGGYRNDGFTIPDGSTDNLVYWQMRVAPGENADSSFGITDTATPGAFGDYVVQVVMSGNDASGYELRARDGASFVTLVSGLSSDVWYDVTVDVNALADTFDVYFDTDEDPDTLGTLVGDDLLFRDQLGAAVASDLQALWGFAGGEPESINVDNIYVMLVPEPSALMLLGVVAVGLASRRRLN